MVGIPESSSLSSMRVFPLRRFVQIVLPVVLFALFAGAGQASAQDNTLYEGESMVDSQSEDQRAAALPRALGQVLVKVTGDPAAASDPAFASGLSGAARMVQQYRYREDVITRNGVPQRVSFLIARFSPQAVDSMIANAGRTVWPAPRPRPLLWLAIDDGRGPRLVGEAQASAVSALTRRAAERGLQMSFPLADVQDQTLGGPQAVWRDDVAAVRDAARRYGAAPLLLGRMRRGDGGWNAEWVLLDGATEVRRWTAVDPNAINVLVAGADGMATALAKNFSTRILSGPAGDYEVLLTGLASAEDYGRALAYLKRVPVVRGVQTLEAVDDKLRLRLQLSTGVEGLSRLLESGGVLRPLETAGDGVAVFQLEP